MITINTFEIENFKSYKGRHILGPFKNFNAIVGPNGCGKSNLMDAICFSLGENLKNLRVNSTEDLIYGSHFKKSTCDFASVTLNFVDDKQKEFKITRKVTNVLDTYYINENQVSKTQYRKFLENFGINIKLKNFIAFQGDVESLLNKGSNHLSKIFERFSGSNKLIKKYETCKEILTKEMNNFTIIFRKRRELMAKKKQLDSEKDEASKYTELEKKLNNSTRNLFLLKLLSLDKSLESERENLNHCDSALSDKLNELENFRNQYNQLKASSSSKFHEISLMEKKINSLEATINDIRVQNSQINSKISYLTQKIEDNSKNLERTEQNCNRHKTEINNLEKDLKQAQELLRSINEEHSFLSSSTSGAIPSSQYEEYIKLKEEFHEKTRLLKAEQDQLKNEKNSCLKSLESFSIKIKELIKQKGILTNNEQDIGFRLERLKKIREEHEYLLKGKKDTLKELSNAISIARQKKDKIESDMSTINETISVYKFDQVEAMRRQRLHEIDEKLRMYFTGVHGLLSDLIEPVHRKYSIALTKVLGKNMEAIVVDDHKTAFDCIEYLKEQQLGRATFLPLNGLRLKPIEEKFRYLGGSAKLMVDVVRYDNPNMKVIVDFTLGSTVVCDSLDEANHMAFEKGTRRKTVSLDGTLFLKNGIISGGSISLNKKAAQWDARRFTNLKTERYNLMNTLKEINLTLDNQIQLDELTLEINDIEQKCSKILNEYNHIRDVACNNLSSQQNKINDQISYLELETDSVKSKIYHLDISIEQISAKMNDMASNNFMEFCEKYGLKTYEDYEDTSFKQLKVISEKRLNCEKHISLLNNQLQYELSKFNLNKKQKLENELKAQTSELNDLKSKKETLSIKLEGLLTEAKDLQSDHLNIKNNYNNDNESLKKLSRSISLEEKNELSLKQSITSIQFKIDTLINQKLELLETSKIKNITLNNTISDILPSIGTLSIPLTGQTDSQLTNQDKTKNVEIDYTCLTESYKDLNEIEEIKQIIQELSCEVENLTSVLTKKVSPNLQILEKYDERMNEINTINNQFDEIKKKVKTIQNDFEALKKHRSSLFMTAFQATSNKIEYIYKSLCNDPESQAFLTVEETDEPYISQISYNCVPPKKRFQSIDQLSGGEKAIAALALLFALHSANQAPFFILDEVDAALDLENIKNLANFIKDSYFRNTICIVISLKEDLYSKSDTLIGVTQDPNHHITSSRIFTICLDKYD